MYYARDCAHWHNHACIWIYSLFVIWESLPNLRDPLHYRVEGVVHESQAGHLEQHVLELISKRRISIFPIIFFKKIQR